MSECVGAMSMSRWDVEGRYECGRVGAGESERERRESERVAMPEWVHWEWGRVAARQGLRTPAHSE